MAMGTEASLTQEASPLPGTHSPIDVARRVGE